MTHIESDMKSRVFKKKPFSLSAENSVTWVILLGGMGDMVKVPHEDRVVSFGNRHSKTSTPKGFKKIIAP